MPGRGEEETAVAVQAPGSVPPSEPCSASVRGAGVPGSAVPAPTAGRGMDVCRVTLTPALCPCRDLPADAGQAHGRRESRHLLPPLLPGRG